MMNDRLNFDPCSRDIPRRLKLSAREIGVAVALTFAAGVQLVSASTGQEQKTGGDAGRTDRAARMQPAALIQPAR